LSAYDWRGHAQLRQRLTTPIATGEMLSSVFTLSYRASAWRVDDARV
jgi:hypothetical protein